MPTSPELLVTFCMWPLFVHKGPKAGWAPPGTGEGMEGDDEWKTQVPAHSRCSVNDNDAAVDVGLSLGHVILGLSCEE